jgi:hypothetical protein
LIHPVAGRCKHCKEDLSTYRAGRPQAAAALPALNGKSTSNGSNGHVAAPAVVAVAEPVVQEASQPILPPRPTGRPMKAQGAPRSSWLSWPVIVIALAAIAIVTAAVIMIMPPSTSTSAKKLSPSPAPERMDTSPLPDKHSQIDPWDQQGGGASPQMPPQQPMPAPPDPDDDLWKDLNKGGGLGANPIAPSGGFEILALEHACKKLTSCPGVDPTIAGAACSTVATLPKPPMKQNCPAQQRCLDKIDQMDCNQANVGVNAAMMLQMVQDCVTAMNC